MELQSCPECGVNVIPMKDGTCPSCRRICFQPLEPASDGVIAKPPSDVQAHTSPPAGPRRDNAALPGSAGSVGRRAGVASGVWFAVALLVLFVVEPNFGLGATPSCIVLLGTVVAILLGGIALGTAGGPAKQTTLVIGILGVILNVALLALMIYAGVMSQQARREMRERQSGEIMKSLE